MEVGGKSGWWKWAALGFIGFSFLPIWRSGDEYGLNLWEVLAKHTVWGEGIKGRHLEGEMPWFPEQRKAYIENEVNKRIEQGVI